MTYEEVYKDWEYLWDISSASDMTGGYVDQEDLAKLLKSPTKATAKACLLSQINYWFESGTEDYLGGYSSLLVEYPEIADIRDKYNCYLGDW